MRIGKSLLLGSAAGIAAVTGAQAADLPVKAKPVEYVKVCSLYGAGFYYIPGTDKCLKIGGFFREQWDVHGQGDAQVFMDTANGTWTRGFTSDSSFRSRTGLTFDVREQSSYGTIRGYTALGADLTTVTAGQTVWFTRSFVQFAGFTGGKSVSFFDFISFDPYGYSNIRTNTGNTGATGIDLFAYTAQLGNGVSATISAEDNCSADATGNGASASGGRGCRVVNTTNYSTSTFAAAAVGTFAPGVSTFSAMGYRIPDIVGSLRVDQAWGSAQIMGAYHPVAADYYYVQSTPAGLQSNGHPSDAAGFAAGAGFLLKDFLGMKGDSFGVQANWARGASAYITNGLGGLAGFSGGINGAGNSLAFGSVVDGVYTSGASGAACNGSNGVAGVGCGSSIELTTAWTVAGLYEHLWSPQLKSSVYGGYVKVTYNDTAANYICNGTFNSSWVRGAAAGTAAAVLNGSLNITGQSSLSSCDPNLSFWSVGTRTQWNPNSNLDLGVDFMWNHLNSANAGTYVSAISYGGRPAGSYSIANYDIWTAAMRMQYNFLP